MDSRSAHTARKFLKDYQGCDSGRWGIMSTTALKSRVGDADVRVGAHARGKFSETLDENNTLASEALVYIGKLHQREPQTDEVLPDYD